MDLRALYENAMRRLNQAQATLDRARARGASTRFQASEVRAWEHIVFHLRRLLNDRRL